MSLYVLLSGTGEVSAEVGAKLREREAFVFLCCLVPDDDHFHSDD